jgi:putative SOS response-associated peptidase YedK
VQGFFEWVKKGKDRKPFYVHPDKMSSPTTQGSTTTTTTTATSTSTHNFSQQNIDAIPLDVTSGLLYFAGLYDCANIEGSDVYSFTIVTTDSAESLKWLHDRMPVILRNEYELDLWLNPKVKFGTEVASLMRPLNHGLEW